MAYFDTKFAAQAVYNGCYSYTEIYDVVFRLAVQDLQECPNDDYSFQEDSNEPVWTATALLTRGIKHHFLGDKETAYFLFIAAFVELGKFAN